MGFKKMNTPLPRKSSTFKFLLAFIVSLILLPQLIFAEQYYIALNGSDQNSGSESNPWRTLSKANLTLRAGDEVIIREGIYHEQICPVNTGSENAPIVYRSYPNEHVVLKGPGETATEAVVAIGYPGKDASWRGSAFIIVDGFEIDPTFASYGIAIYGSRTRHNIIRNCHLVCNTPTEPRNHGVLIGSAQHTLIENNRITGDWHAGIITTSSPKYTIIRGNEIEGVLGNCIDIQTSVGNNQAMLIEKNRLIGARSEDGIQFEPDYSLSFDHGSFRGVIIRHNVIAENAENAIDLKGSAHVVIEGNIIYGNRGDNNGSGNVSGGTGGIMKGDITKTQAHNILIRRNFIYDNKGGISIHNHRWVVVHNTIIGNNRTYKGPDCSLSEIASESSSFLKRFPGLAGVRLTEEYAPSFDYCMIKNNIMGGNHQGELAILHTKDLSKVEIDGNLYFSSEGVTMGDVAKAWSWNAVSFQSMRSRFSGAGGPLGGAQHSRELNQSPLNMAGDAPVGAGPYDYSPSSQSGAIDAGLPLVTTRSAGSGAVVPVSNARCFSSGYEIVPGDTIVVHSTGEVAHIIDIDTEANTITLDRSMSWQANEGISTIFDGKAPDIGAIETHETAVTPPATPLSGMILLGDDAGYAPFSVEMTAEATGGLSPYQYVWQFGDNAESQLKTVQHLYTVPGQYVVSLRITDTNGHSVTVGKEIDVLEPLDVQINIPSMSKRLLVPTTTQFHSNVTGGVAPYTYTWHVNGQQSGNADILAHSFSTGGLNQVALLVTDQHGASATDTLEFETYLPLLLHLQNQVSATSAPATLNLSCSAEGGTAPYTVKWYWDSQIQSQSWNITRLLGSAGVWETICLIEDSNGQSVRDTVTIALNGPLTVESNLTNRQGTPLIPVVFEGQAEGGTGPYQYQWDFGDGAISTEANTTHAYQVAGQYVVNLKVTDAQNTQATVTGTVSIEDPVSLASIQDVALMDPETGTEVLRVVTEQWVELKLKVVPQTTWDDVGFVDCILRRGNIDQSVIDARGGAYAADENYVFSLSVTDNTIWAKQSEGGEDWNEITGQQGAYLDGRSSVYRIDRTTGFIYVRLKLHQKAQHGEWALAAVAYDSHRVAATPMASKLFVQDQAHTPYAKIVISNLSVNAVDLKIESTRQLNRLPQTLSFIDNKGRLHPVQLQGNLPGNQFTGRLLIDGNMAVGRGQFVFSDSALADTEGNLGDQIISGAIFEIDLAAPSSPRNVKIIE